MSEHFIKDIEIKSYKLFKDFKASGFNRVNLIGGKNNVGKTAFMEACYINSYAKDVNYTISSIYAVEYARNFLEYVDENEPDVYKVLDKVYNCNIKTNIRDTNFNIEINNSKRTYNILNKKLNRDDFSQDYADYSYPQNILFLDNLGFRNSDFKDEYGAVQSKDKEEVLNKYLNKFDSNIEKFKIINDKPKCKIKEGEYIDINDFGYGLKEYIAIVISIYSCENGYLYIDEVANGIHYSQYDKLWEIILTLSKEQNVQVFATTHSKELIESYARVAKKLEDEDITYFSIGKNKQNELRGIVYPYDWFIDSVEQEQELRGW